MKPLKITIHLVDASGYWSIQNLFFPATWTHADRLEYIRLKSLVENREITIHSFDKQKFETGIEEMPLEILEDLN